jgi:glycine/D-amino acid oxidase-like deaminating enzyme
MFYGFPIVENVESSAPIGLKIAHHFRGEDWNADLHPTEVSRKSKDVIQWFLKKYFNIKYESIAYRQCLYTYSEDGDFILDFLPGFDGQVAIACGFSGHGFKFVPVVGEIMADLITHGKTNLPIDFLRVNRFNKKK